MMMDKKENRAMKRKDMHLKQNRAMQSRRMVLIGAALCAFVIIGCNRNEKPVYEATADRLYMGSLLYAKFGCANCHGVDWDGNGPDAAGLAENGIQTTSFVKEITAETTPVDYFKAISDPAGYFAEHLKTAKNPVEYKKFSATHVYQNTTDLARWEMANFLYSKAANSGSNADKVKAELEEAKNVYAGNRRWEIGYVPIAERSTAPALDDLIRKAKIQKEMSMPGVSEERKKAAFDSTPGARLYYSECASCHGNFAEGGVARDRIGLLADGPQLENDKGIPRKAMAFESILDLRHSSAMGSLGAFQSAHANRNDQLTETYSSFTDEEWQELYTYTKRLTGQ